MIKPKRLQRGNRIAAVSLSWGGPGTFPLQYQFGKRQLETAFGVEVIEMPHTLKPADWIAANPRARADDLMQAFADPNIDAIISTIGGDDSIRTLPFIDFAAIRNNPKIFMGFSDTTITHFACFKAGLTSFYGPAIMAGFGENGGLFPYTEQAVRTVLCALSAAGLIEPSTFWTDERMGWHDPANQTRQRARRVPLGRRLLQGEGVVEGPLIGGCVDVFPMLLGTDLWPTREQFDGAILFLETSEEALPVRDFIRTLRNLGVQGILERLSGIILARPSGELPDEELTRYDDALAHVVGTEFGLKQLPILTQLDFGHTYPICVLPLGIKAQIDCEAKAFRIIESAVV